MGNGDGSRISKLIMGHYQIVPKSCWFPFPGEGVLRYGDHSLTKWPMSLAVVMFI